MTGVPRNHPQATTEAIEIDLATAQRARPFRGICPAGVIGERDNCAVDPRTTR